MNNLAFVLGHVAIDPAKLEDAEWSKLLEKARDILTSDYLRGFRSARNILESYDPGPLNDVNFRAKPDIVQKGMRSQTFKSNDLFLYCTTVWDNRFPWNTLQARAREGSIKSSDIVLAKKGMFWQLNATWRYMEPSADIPNPWGYTKPWLEAEGVSFEFLGLGHGPLGRLCLQKQSVEDERFFQVYGNRLFGTAILRAMYEAQRETEKDLERRRKAASEAARSLKGYLERLGGRM